MEVALVEAARFLGGQPFVPSRLAAQFPHRLISTERRTGVHSSCPRPGGIMRTYSFPLAVILTLAIAFPSHAAEKPRPAQAAKTKKVWTNDDMDQLRARGLISTFSVAPETTAQAQAAPSEQATFTPKTEDPAWYADQAAILQAELDKRESALREAQSQLDELSDLARQNSIPPGVLRS